MRLSIQVQHFELGLYPGPELPADDLRVERLPLRTVHRGLRPVFIQFDLRHVHDRQGVPHSSARLHRENPVFLAHLFVLFCHEQYLQSLQACLRRLHRLS